MRLASIDLGSNSLILTIVDKKNNGVSLVKEWVRIIRLGEGLQQGGRLENLPKKRCLEVLKNFSIQMKTLGVEKILAVGTAALRNATDGQNFVDQIKNKFAIPLTILSGDEEAKLTFKAVQHEFAQLGKSLFMIDIGGGSTELVEGDGESITSRISLKAGTVSLSEKFVKHDPPTSEELHYAKMELIEMISSLSLQLPKSVVIGVAGTVTTLKAVELEMDDYDHSLIHSTKLKLSSIIKLGKLFGSISNVERAKLKGLSTERADIIPMGVVILENILKKIGQRSLIISDHGLRWGLIYDWIDENF